MKISEIITDKYKLRIPPTVYYDLLADVREVEEEQEPHDDWYDVPSDEMTLEQARQAVKDLRKKLAEYLEQEPTTNNNSPKYCDRSICLKNEYNNIGCEDCEVTKSQEPTTKNDLGVDCISRKAALDITWLDPSYSDPLNVLTEVRDKIRELPSVTPQELKWIPVSEKLPKVADCYAVTRQIGSDLIVSACFFDIPNTWYDDTRINHERNYLTNIVAWMPLPQAYKAESESDVQ